MSQQQRGIVEEEEEEEEADEEIIHDTKFVPYFQFGDQVKKYKVEQDKYGEDEEDELQLKGYGAGTFIVNY